MTLALIVGASAAQALVVDHADDVCARGTDPCVIATPVAVANGTTLDFGRREVRVVPGGQLDVGIGTVEIICGAFHAMTTGAVALRVRGPSPGGGQDGGSLTIMARSGCARDLSQPCQLHGHCMLGPCEAGSCRGNRSRLCSSDGECDLGSCGPGGGVSIAGTVEAQGILAGAIVIEAAGDVILADAIDLDSTDADGDGGDLEVVSRLGSVVLSGRVEATSGRNGAGGNVLVAAAHDVSLRGLIDASGGDVDGGEVEVFAGRNLTLSSHTRVDARSGEGAGGIVQLEAGGDLRLTATASLSANGHLSAENFAGDGGTFTLVAGGDLWIDAGAIIEADGAKPDAAGGNVEMFAEGNVSLRGALGVAARGGRGLGGVLSVEACEIELGSMARMENRGALGSNVLTARGVIRVASGAALLADAKTGLNTLRYRDQFAPPEISGTVVPAPTLHNVPGLPRCASATTTTLPAGDCGNGLLDLGEDCDDGDRLFTRGDACTASCLWVACGDPDNSGAVNSTDALVVLRVAVGLEACHSCVCNVDSIGAAPSASDALRLLNVAVGLPTQLACPACSP